mgnify:CR=1 FL=1
MEMTWAIWQYSNQPIFMLSQDRYAIPSHMRRLRNSPNHNNCNKGVTCSVNNDTVFIGNRAWMHTNSFKVPFNHNYVRIIALIFYWLDIYWSGRHGVSIWGWRQDVHACGCTGCGNSGLCCSGGHCEDGGQGGSTSASRSGTRSLHVDWVNIMLCYVCLILMYNNIVIIDELLLRSPSRSVSPKIASLRMCYLEIKQPRYVDDSLTIQLKPFLQLINT